MVDTLNLLTERLRTTQEVGDIVRTMKSLSAVSIHQYETAARALQAYQRSVDKGLQVVLRARPPREAPRSPRGRAALVAFGSDRGLCGRFNRVVAEEAVRFVRVTEDASETAPRLLVVGAQAEARLAAQGVEAEAAFQTPGSARAIERTARAILVRLQQWQDEGLGSVTVVSARRGERTQVDVRTRRIAPIDEDELRELAAAPWRSRRLPVFTMPAEELLSWLLRERLFIGLQRAAAESLAAEHAMRLAAMQAAERNIDERLDEVRQAVRQVRQDTITRELLDIVGGYEASRSDEGR